MFVARIGRRFSVALAAVYPCPLDTGRALRLERLEQEKQKDRGTLQGDALLMPRMRAATPPRAARISLGR
jgi:hypothetical protein